MTQTPYFIDIAKDFTSRPCGRYIEHGSSSGQAFRETHLLPILRTWYATHQNTPETDRPPILIEFAGLTMCPSSWAEEAFGGAVRERDDLPLWVFNHIEFLPSRWDAHERAKELMVEQLHRENMKTGELAMSNLTHIVAVANTGVIGSCNHIPWNSPADMRFFRETTDGAVVVMGRKTYDSIPATLTNRIIVVLTNDPNYVPSEEKCDKLIISSSVLEGVKTAFDKYGGEVTQKTRAYICGGGEIYRLTQDLVNEAIVCRIDVDVEGDTLYTVPSHLSSKNIVPANHPDGSRDPLIEIQYYAL